ncbi:MAG: hypothetical protein Q9176_006703 [Flavoplaca citrina]
MRIPAALQTLHSDDLTFHLAKEYGWSLGEVTSGLTYCCLPCLPKLFRHFTGRLKHYYSHQKSSSMHSVERAKSAALVPGAKRQSTYFELGGLPLDGQDPKKDDYSVDVRAVV